MDRALNSRVGYATRCFPFLKRKITSNHDIRVWAAYCVGKSFLEHSKLDVKIQRNIATLQNKLISEGRTTAKWNVCLINLWVSYFNVLFVSVNLKVIWRRWSFVLHASRLIALNHLYCAFYLFIYCFSSMTFASLLRFIVIPSYEINLKQ